MRTYLLAAVGLLMIAPARAETDIAATCYTECEASTKSNPEFKACLARAAGKADAALNTAYQKLQDAIGATAEEAEQKPDLQLSALKDAQKSWIAYRDTNCTFEDELAFGGTAMGGVYSGCVCALSYERINDFQRIRSHVLFID